MAKFEVTLASIIYSKIVIEDVDDKEEAIEEAVQQHEPSCSNFSTYSRVDMPRGFKVSYIDTEAAFELLPPDVKRID